MAEPEKDKLRERLVDLLPIDDLDLGPGDTTPLASDIEDSDNSSLDDSPVAGVAVGNKSRLFTLLEQKKKRKKRAVVEEDLSATHVGRVSLYISTTLHWQMYIQYRHLIPAPVDWTSVRLPGCTNTLR